MNRLESAENKLNEFIAKWSEHYKLTHTETINLLLGKSMELNNNPDKVNTSNTTNINNVNEKSVSEIKITDGDTVQTNIPFMKEKGILYLKKNDKLVYVDSEIDKYVKDLKSQLFELITGKIK